MEKILLVDASFLCYQTFYGWAETGTTPSFQLKKMVNLFAYPKQVMVFDSPFKKGMYFYKGHRDSKAKKIIHEVYAPALTEIVQKSPSWDLVKSVGKEADDLICELVKDYHFHKDIDIYTSDKDLYPLCQFKNVHIGTSVKNGKVVPFDKKSFLKKHNLSNFNQYILFKTFMGDPSDGIKLFERFPKKLAINLALTFPSIDILFQDENKLLSTCMETLSKKELAEKWFKQILSKKSLLYYVYYNIFKCV